MKNLMSGLLCAALLALAFGVHAASSVSLGWTGSPGATDYKIFCGSATGNYGATPVLDVPSATAVTATITPAPGTYFCAMKAYNTTQPESAYSNEVTFVVPQPPLDAPKGFTATVKISWNPDTNTFVASIDVNGVPIPTTP